MTSEDTEDLLNQRVSAYVLAVETMKNGQEAISAQDVGLSYVSTGIVKQLIKDQDRFTWFLAFNQDKNYDISESLSYNVELMGQAVDNLKCMQPENVVQPVDAQIQDTGDTFEIIPEVMGNALDCTKTEEVISAAMLRGKTSVNLEDESCYRKPSVYSTDEQLKANCEKMNQLVKVIITYDFADRTETVDRTLIKNWFGYDEDGNVILDENLVRQYVADLGLKYDTMGQTRTFLTYDNRQVEIKGGDYGWVIDQDEEVKALKEHVETVAKTAVGKKFIDFTLNTPEGKPVKLSDFIAANNYTLIDFWASWCGPCRKEMPNVVAAYKEFKNKGFGIVGVSLDNNLDKWKEAITALDITWPQMSDLQGWNNAGAKLYGVNSIPATVLVDQEGTIVARNLRGEDIKAKLSELLK